VLAKLEPEVPAEAGPQRAAWLEQIRGWREQFPPKQYPKHTPKLYQPQVLQALHRATRGEAIIVADVGQHQMFAAQHYEYVEPYTYITSGGLGTMGYSIPAAIGAQMARPEKQVWCVVGDGCFQQTLQELAVISSHRVPVKIALLNNEYLGMVRQQQQVQYRGNIVEVDLAGCPDYIKLAQAYGIPAWRVTEASDVDTAIGAAMAYAGPAIIEFRVARTEDVYPWVLGGTSLGEVLPDTPYEERVSRERSLASAAPSPKDATDR
jgi:acetolactate synthase-1/2/3 large subunit